MRPVRLSSPPMLDKDKLDWCIKAIQDIALASQTADTNAMADSFTLANVTATRTLDADTATLAQLSDVVGTLLQDMKRRGQKGAGV